ncbi:MAG TPA: WbuC family cupin fold metalloprotein [Prolixibacteraceae bacterium]|nr:WbuC family cupin fold metalloprotein [Prolixibacteraceae bacterium]
MVKIISPKTLDDLTFRATNSSRRRQNLNYHEDLADPMNRMLNAFEPGTYIQPHKHENPDKREVFIVLRGSLVLVIFDDSGHPVDFVLLDLKKGNYAVEVEPGIWHSVISLESGTVVYEIKDGPYIQPLDKNFALWAPKEGDENCGEYLARLTEQFYSR